MKAMLCNILVYAFFFLPFSTGASQCKPKTITESYDQADLVLTGRATKIIYAEPRQIDNPPKTGQLCGDKTILFDNLHIYKNLDDQQGNTPKDIQIFSSDGCIWLGGYYTEGRTYLVYARYYDDKLQTSVCDRSRDIEENIGKPDTSDELKTLEGFASDRERTAKTAARREWRAQGCQISAEHATTSAAYRVESATKEAITPEDRKKGEAVCRNGHAFITFKINRFFGFGKGKALPLVELDGKNGAFIRLHEEN